MTDKFTFGISILPNAYPMRRPAEFVCTVPPELGVVTKLKIKGERVVAETESGIEMVVPIFRKNENAKS